MRVFTGTKRAIVMAMKYGSHVDRQLWQMILKREKNSFYDNEVDDARLMIHQFERPKCDSLIMHGGDKSEWSQSKQF
jgi:hypothetical protein